ncbi:MAG: PEP/pyruvate-binding domain-containing protein [Chloroflexota bacterium]
MNKFCLAFRDINRQDVPLAGGKGANLGDMIQAGLPVPPGFVITAAAYRRMFESSGLESKVCDCLRLVDREDNQALMEVEHEIRALFQQQCMDPELCVEILEHYHGLGENIPVAVRSSATAEDLVGASFAGQQNTFLNVYGDDELIRAVLDCWSSLFTCQAIYYRYRNGFDDTQVSMAVVVQKMICADKAGVIFTVDPVSRNSYQMVIEGVYGLGEGIVSGTITPDHFKIDRETLEIRFKYIAPKGLMFTKDSVCGCIEIPVPEELKNQPVLNEQELELLVKMANRVEAHFGSPQDIEWGAEADQFYLLQSRPITTL